MDNRNFSNELAAYGCLFWLTLGLIFIPILSMITLLRDGFEETPWWMTIVALTTLFGGGAVLVAALVQSVTPAIH